MPEEQARFDLVAALPALSRLAEDLFAGQSVPAVARVRQRLQAPLLSDIEATAAAETGRVIARSGRSPQTVAVGIGSRGIANLARIARAAVDSLKAAGFQPFIVPAMGSHGAATARGQVEVLAAYGIDEDSMGVPVRATMETEVIGHAGHTPIHMDRLVVEAGAVFLIARIKPHTDIRGEVESGLTKMCTIGLGKQRGAQIIHATGIDGLRDNIVAGARIASERGLLLGGLGIVENQRDETALIKGLTGAEVAGPAEAELLSEARRLLPKVPFGQVDVLVVDRMGKDISGAGMDVNVLNRWRLPGVAEPTDGLQVTCVTVHDLTPASHGNGVGIGLADFMPARLVGKLDFAALYTNSLTAGVCGFPRAKLPVVLPTDKDVVLAAIASRGRPPHEPLRLAWISDTLHTETLAVSEALLQEAAAQGELFEIVSELEPMPFDRQGQLEPLAAALV